MSLRHGSLFSGIGGFDLAASWMGWENIFQVEIDPFCQKVLEKNFPSVTRYGDIKEFDGTKYRGAIDVLSGGFPCQPFSYSGRRKGKEDDRYLWPEMLRVIGEVKPTFIVGENVSGSWELVDEICSGLEHRGYTTEPFGVEAASVGADHKRFRYWFTAYSSSLRLEGSIQEDASNKKLLGIRQSNSFSRSSIGSGVDLQRSDEHLRRDNGVPNWTHRIKGLGNAIVPQVAFEIFKAIEQTVK